MSGFRRPSWWALLLTVAGALLFVRLGVWQLHRADFKEDLLRRYAAAAAAPLQDFAGVAEAPPADGFPRVRVDGHYLADRVYLLDNPKHDRRGGVQVYAPLVLDGHAPLLLVDLGFLPGNGSDKPPQVPPLPIGRVSLQGLYVPPPPVGFEMGGNALARQTQWPKSSIFLDPAQVAADLGRPLYPRVLALDPDLAAIYERERNLDFSSMPPARHRAYAFQWFTFALAAVVILLVVHRKRKPRRSDSTKVDENR
ncbi:MULTISPECIES: SURF1 family protein [Rhodanobacter]|uniref:SURF1 family protein n=1 Tax=Rhodanobacter TaxID=75309 RepID=UPI00041DA1E3|nr:MULTISPECIES: SURF1 family protein [Rhodanobacter]TAN15504.1 MAG: SURF1 family protein [Rhodanobacter sp.]UJJ55070.1 SURF1 family protein [Rhodanobacter thiooxydans]